MADDVVLNPGLGGDTIAADDIGGSKFQRVKLVHGANGVNVGDVSHGNPLPTIPWISAMVRSGKAFYAESVKASATAILFTFKVPTGSTKTYMSLFFSTDTDAVLAVKEAPTWTVDTGSRVVLNNLDRDSATTSQVEDDTAGGAFSDNDSIALDQTGLASGTTIFTRRTSTARDMTEHFDSGISIKLANNTQYAIDMTATSGAIALGILLIDTDEV